MDKNSKICTDDDNVLANPFAIFAISVLKNIQPINQSINNQFKRYLKKKKQSKKYLKWNPQLTNEQTYHNEVFYYMNNTIEAFDKLRQIPYFIKRFRNSPTYKKEGITLHKWVHYHYSNYIVTVVSLYDTILLLINAVFLIGLKPRDCTHSTIIDNRRIAGLDVKGAVNELNKIVKPYREPRNRFIHRFQFANLELLDNLETRQLIVDTEKAFGLFQENEDEDILMNPFIIKILYGKERTKIVKELREQTKVIAKSLKKVFDSLTYNYELYSNQF